MLPPASGSVLPVAFVLTFGLAATVKSQDLYVSDYNDGTIGEYGLDGSTVSASLISGLYNPWAVAISPAPEPSMIALAGLAAAFLGWRRRRQTWKKEDGR